ncbi:MAG TPA: PTS sugar transporter subunit IIA [Candidatus Hydrogenedens sp.]|nr:PTS sugar transporter subunit IIA [Candidatus Hydrogenedens sp.]HOK10373.1 PTS sugar transporter subunit IIA [Candidatus Hydrogenedens sp.]HOL21177.1 PTS sugar transporter subunit IIA [Candidatus Hydrogenedens sp.]HPP59872.1 PTS sugar transporter subunit IIA [Candidatus Hydrogenedens sp.]
MPIFGREIPESQICIIRGKTTKYDVLNTLIDLVKRNPAITDPELFKKAVFDREEVTSTGIGGGIAIPHVRMDEVKDITIGIAIVPDGVDFDSIDNQPVYLVVLFATPKNKDKEYLQMVAKVMQALRDESLYQRMIKCNSPRQLALCLNTD